MIITVFSGGSRIEKSILAINLAALRALNQRKVLLIDADTQKHTFLWSIRRGTDGGSKVHLPLLPIVDTSLYSELEHLNSRYQDIVIDAGGMDKADTRTALVAARIVVVPICVQARDERAEAAVTELLDLSKIFNPLMRVVLVVVHDRNTNASIAEARARALAGGIRSATIAHTVIEDDVSVRSSFRRGVTLFDHQPVDKLAVAQLEALEREVFGSVDEPSRPAADIKAAIAAIKTWYQRSKARSRPLGDIY